MTKCELLAPAGDLNRLKWGIIYGADAVYIGGREFGLRANATNFSIDEMKEGVEFAHKHNARVYVTVNIVFHNEDIEGLDEYLKQLDDINVDAIIFSDPLVMQRAKKYSFELHLSTQQSTLNYESVKFWEENGVKKVVLGRELSKQEIIEIKEKTNIELEVFIHGSLCLAYSGRCVLSNYMTGRDSNRGGCSQICRWDFNLLDGAKKDITGDIPFTMCTKDLAMVEYINELKEIGVSSLKIEGRMRSIYYIATVVSIYRKVLDTGVYTKEDQKILRRCSNRDNAVQYFNKMPGVDEQYYNGRWEPSNQDFLGIVLDYKDNYATIEQRNHFKKGDKVLVFGPNKKPVTFEVTEIIDDKGNIIDKAPHPRQVVTIYAPYELSKHDIMRVDF